MSEIPYRVVRSKRKSLGLEIVSGPEVLVRAPQHVSDAVIAQFVQKHKDWILRKLDARRNTCTIHSELTEEKLLELTQKAEATIPDRVAHFAPIMNLRPTAIRITRTRSRFGSCCKKNKLSFSCRLMLYPPEAVDYVVVHELAHILHKNHGPDFWQTVAEVLPDYRQRVKMLRV